MKCLRKFVPYLLVIMVLVLIFPIICGCSGPDESNRFHKLLELVPASVNVDENFIIINDYESCFEDIGISLAELDEQSASFQEFTDLIREKEINVTLIPLTVGSDIVGWGRYASQEIIQDKNVGYSFASVDLEIQAGVPPDDMVAAIGRYDSEATREALKNQDEWPNWAVAAYNSEEYHGVIIHAWGDGYEIHMDPSLGSMPTPPHIDMLGRARPLAVTDEYLFYAASVDTIKSMIDASQGKVESLADLPEYAQIVGQMSGLNIYSLLMGSESLVNGDPEHEGTYSGPKLKKFVTFGTASGQDETGNFIALVLYHENPEDAEANASLLEERINTTDILALDTPWMEIITTTDIRADGNLLVAKLYTIHLNLWVSWVYGDEPILLHEQ